MGTIAKVTAGGSTHLIASTCYGTCGTAAGTAAKVATIQDSQAFTLLTGVTVHIKFTYSNTVASPTLNVNSTGAKAIKAYGTTASGTSTTASWYAGSIVSFTYDGTNWIQNDYKSSADRVAKSGDTMTGNLTMRMDSEKTASANPDTPAQISLQTRWTDQTAAEPAQKTSTSYIRAYSDHSGNGNNIVISPGGNVFLGGGEAPQNHYALYKNSTSEKAFLTADTDIHIQGGGGTIANRRGFLVNSNGDVVPERADVATNNAGSIGTDTIRWGNGYFTKINNVSIEPSGITFSETSGQNIACPRSQFMTFGASSEIVYWLCLGVIGEGSSARWAFAPASGGQLRLGDSEYKWGQIYSTNSTISTSDRNEKKDISSLDESAKDFIMALNPVSYKFINGDTGRTHYGMISQDIEETLSDLGMTAMDFAGFCKDQKTESYEVEVVDESGETHTEQRSRDVEGEYVYGLRYEEFIAPMIKTIQMQQKEIDELKAQVKLLLGGKG